MISLDGKQLRGSYDRRRQQSPLSVVSAWSTQNRMMLGLVKVEEKSNEIKAIPVLRLVARHQWSYHYYRRCWNPNEYC